MTCPDPGLVERQLLGIQQLSQQGQPLGLDLVGQLRGRRRRGPRARRIFEGIGLGEAHVGHQAQGLREVPVALAGEADDEVGRQRQVGGRRAQPLDQPAVVVGRVAPVHGPENPVGARLDGKVQEGRQLAHLGVGGDQLVVHVARMRRGVAQARQPIDLRQAADEAAQAPGRRTSAAHRQAPRHGRR